MLIRNVMMFGKSLACWAELFELLPSSVFMSEINCFSIVIVVGESSMCLRTRILPPFEDTDAIVFSFFAFLAI